MLNINLLRENYDEVVKKLETRGKKYEQLNDFKKIDTEWRDLTTKIQTLNAEINKASKEIGKLMAAGQKEEAEEKTRLIKNTKNEIASFSKKQEELNAQLTNILLSVPNLPDKSVPVGKDETQNVEVNKFSTPTKFDFKPLPHWDLAEKLGLIDFERGVKICGSRYIMYLDKGARLIRALQWYTLEMNTQAGFKEILPPVVVRRESLIGTGQLPKFEEDLYKLNSGDYLSPTGEVQLTNLYRNEIIDGKKLPCYFTTDTCCFRSEAGSAGKDTRGVIRQHQFYKTEMVKIVSNEHSFDESVTHD